MAIEIDSFATAVNNNVNNKQFLQQLQIRKKKKKKILNETLKLYHNILWTMLKITINVDRQKIKQEKIVMKQIKKTQKVYQK